MFNERFSNALQVLNYTLHLFIALALAAASVLIMIQFSRDVLGAFREHILAAGVIFRRRLHQSARSEACCAYGS
ncbi:hypothetical protein [Acidithiobacillus sp.]